MHKIKVTELFWSIQGEGRYVGTPSIFLRTFGCNFRCPSFGMHMGYETNQPDEILSMVSMSPDSFKSIKDLPLSTKGCDSYISWHPGFKDYSPLLEVNDIVKNIKDLLPNGKFSSDKHLVITGGEPLLGWQRAYPDLISVLIDECDLSNVTFETNGTQALSDEFKKYMHDSVVNFHFSVSPKLSNSGEKWADSINPSVVAKYAHYGILDFKFVIDSGKGSIEAFKALSEYKNYGVVCDTVYFMPEGGTNETYQNNSRIVCELAMKNGVRYSPRLQNDLFKNEWST